MLFLFSFENLFLEDKLIRIVPGLPQNSSLSKNITKNNDRVAFSLACQMQLKLKRNVQES